MIRKDYDCAKTLLSYNAIPDHLGRPLYIATFDNNFDMVKLLVKFGADVNKKSTSDEYPLFAACAKGYIDIVK